MFVFEIPFMMSLHPNPVARLNTFEPLNNWRIKTFVSKILFLFVLFTKHSSLSQNLNSSLTACYNLNGNTFDAINNLHGDWLYGLANVTTDRFNTANSAVYLINNSTSYITLPNSPLLKPSNEISFSCWVSPIGGSSYKRIVFTRNNQSSGGNVEAFELAFKITSSNLCFVASKTSALGTNSVSTSSTLSPSPWNHVAFTMDNSFIKIYLNGVLDGSVATTFSGFDYDPNAKVILGSAANTTTNNFPYAGSIDNVRFYNRAITATEVGLLYTQDPNCYSSPPPPPVCGNVFYTISEGAIYAHNYGSTITPTIIPIVLPATAYGLAIGPPFGFTAPNPTYWITAGGTFWYFDGSVFVNTTHSTGTGVTNLGASANFIYAQNNTNGQLFKYNGTGSATLLTTFAATNSAYDITGDDMDNFYTMDLNNPPNLVIRSALGAVTCSMQPWNLSPGTVSSGFAMNSSSIAIHQYFNFHMGSNLPNLAFSVSTYSQPGINDFGSCPFTSTFTPSLVATPSIVSCANPSITIYCDNGSGTVLSPINFTWSTPSGTIPYNSSIQAGVPGTYACNVFNSCIGKYASTAVTIAAGNTPLTPGISASKTVNCIPGPGVVLHASGGTNYTLVPGALTGTNFTVNPTQNTVYTLQATGSGTCAGTKTIAITAIPKPTVTITVASQTICAGTNIYLNASGATGYFWLPYNYSGSTLIATPFSSQTFTVIGTNSTCTGSTQISIQVDQYPILTVNVGSSLCQGESVGLSAGGASSYTWQPGNLSGSSVTVAPASSVVYTVAGNYILNTCVSSETLMLSVSPCLQTSESEKRLQLKFYPNPANEFFFLDCDTDLTLSIYTPSGHRLKEEVLKKGLNNIEIKLLPVGVYYLHFVSKTGVEITKLLKTE